MKITAAVAPVRSAVADLAPGDPVVISFPWCGGSEPCRAGGQRPSVDPFRPWRTDS